MEDLKVRILAKALSHRNTGDPMSIEEIADYALEQHKEILSDIARYNTGKTRKFGYKKWSALHVIGDLQERAK